VTHRLYVAYLSFFVFSSLRLV